MRLGKARREEVMLGEVSEGEGKGAKLVGQDRVEQGEAWQDRVGRGEVT